MPENRVQLNGFGRLGRIQKQVLAAGLDSLNVRQMADVPEFSGPSCARCHHRFGTTSNATWCKTHWQQSRCYRFKLEKR